MHCTVCRHPGRHDIDLALLSRRHTLESLHRRFGVSVSALFRHRKHMQDRVIEARDRLEYSQRQGCLLKLNALLAHVQQAVRTAEGDGDLDRVIRGASVSARIIHQINQMQVYLDLETVYRLISAPGFISQDALLPTDPRVLADLHQAVVDTACVPCPEPPPAAASPDASEDAPDLAGGPRTVPNPVATVFENENPEQPEISPSLPPQRLDTLRLIQSQYPDLELPVAILAAAAKNPDMERKITEKLPEECRRDFTLAVANYRTNQADTEKEKKLSKFRAKGPPG